MNGTEKAALLLLGMGEEQAAKVLQHMGKEQVEALGRAMSSIANIPQKEVQTAVGDFLKAFKGQSNIGIDSSEYVRNTLIKALGHDRAGGLVNQLTEGGENNALETLKWMDPQGIYRIIKNEHPQVIAIILSYLDPAQASQVLATLPEEQRLDLAMRVTQLDGIHPEALSELNTLIANQFSQQDFSKPKPLGGKNTLIEIIKTLDKNTEEKLMDALREQNAELAEEIKDSMFVFDNLIELDDRALQAILRDVASDALLIALKGADDELKEKIFKNMSKRAAELLKDDLEAKGPVKISEVEAAQKDVITVVMGLAEKGEISVGAGSGEEMI